MIILGSLDKTTRVVTTISLPPFEYFTTSSLNSLTPTNFTFATSGINVTPNVEIMQKSGQGLSETALWSFSRSLQAASLRRRKPAPTIFVADYGQGDQITSNPRRLRVLVSPGRWAILENAVFFAIKYGIRPI